MEVHVTPYPKTGDPPSLTFSIGKVGIVRIETTAETGENTFTATLKGLAAGEDVIEACASSSACVQETLTVRPAGVRTSRLLRVTGEAEGDFFGAAVAAIGDVDADGHADFAVGAYGADPSGKNNAGSVYVFSGTDARLLFRVDGEAPGDYFGSAVAGGRDLNRDGMPDFLVGAFGADPSGLSSAGAAYAISGSDGRKLFVVQGESEGDFLGRALAFLGDLNGDGIGEFMAGATGVDIGEATDAGRVLVFSGADGAILLRLDGRARGDRFGFALSAAGDLDGDTWEDIIVGAPYADPRGVTDAGSAYIFSVAYGQLRYQVNGVDKGDHCGFAVAGGGDVNGGNWPDFAVGAPQASIERQTDRYASRKKIDGGAVYVFSGSKGAFLYLIGADHDGAQFGSSIAMMPDSTGDGQSDLIVGAFTGAADGSRSPGVAYRFSGGSGELLDLDTGEIHGDAFGYAVASIGDAGGDGLPDYLVGDPLAAAGKGAAHILASTQ